MSGAPTGAVEWLQATRAILERSEALPPREATVSPEGVMVVAKATGLAGAWTNLVDVLSDASPAPADLDVYGQADRELLHIIHHGPSGGLYKAWAASEMEARALVALVTYLQGAAQAAAKHLKERKSKAKARQSGSTSSKSHSTSGQSSRHQSGQSSRHQSSRHQSSLHQSGQSSRPGATGEGRGDIGSSIASTVESSKGDVHPSASIKSVRFMQR